MSQELTSTDAVLCTRGMSSCTCRGGRSARVYEGRTEALTVGKEPRSRKVQLEVMCLVWGSRKTCPRHGALTFDQSSCDCIKNLQGGP